MTEPKPWGEDPVIDPKDARIESLERERSLLLEAVGLLMGECDVMKLSPALHQYAITVDRNPSGQVVVTRRLRVEQ